ncbi:hypothetical protein [Streptomyces sp. NPDC046860]|uniref:hypothetical protein n=1 Tax=Streptomyces sp. NPDC046860 TaxID=3154495 RepID=UPI0033E61456
MPRHALRAGSTAVAVGLLTLGAAPAGHADEAPETLRFSDYGKTVNVEPYTDGGYTSPLWTSAVNTSSQPLKDFTVTIDASAFKGQLSLSASDTPTPCVSRSESVLVCDSEKLDDGRPVPPGGHMRGIDFRLRTLAAARPGFSGQIRITAEKNGAVIGKTGIKAAVADIGPVTDRHGQDVSGVKPGAVLGTTAGFTQYSARGLDGVWVSASLSPGLSFTKEFGNCEYGDEGYGSGARCYVETPVEPGHAYDVGSFPFKVDGTALAERWGVTVSAERPSYPELSHSHRGDGPRLNLSERPSGPGLLQRGGASASVQADNTLDLQVLGTSVDGKAGQVVRAKLGVRNNGAAVFRQWYGSDRGDDPGVIVQVTVPAGTTAVDVPERCKAMGESGAQVYWCYQDVDDTWFEVGQLTSYDFGLRIDKPSALAPGSVKLTRPESDDNSKNNTAAVIVTVDGKLGDGSVPAPGGDGSTGGSGGSGSAGGTGSTAGSQDSAGTSAAGGTGTGAPDPAPRGSMASTGAGPLAWYAAGAAAVLATGASLFTAARRRRAA